MKKKYVFFILVLLTGCLLQAQVVTKIIQSENLKSANISLLFRNIETGQTILQHRSEKVAIPASTTKLITTATALELLGSEFCFETFLEYDGKIENGVLNGNLYIRGGGDPTLGSRYLGDGNYLIKWIDAIKALGIKEIQGAVIADASLYSTEGISPKWTWEDMGNYYAAGVYALSVADNSCTVVLKSSEIGSTPEIVRTEPIIPELTFDLKLKATSITFDSAYFYGESLVNQRTLYGAIPAFRTEFPVKADIPNPPLYLAQLFTQTLMENKITVGSKAMASFERGQNRTLFYTNYSPPLREIIKEINYRSNNHYAEHLFRYLALQKSPIATSNAAIVVVKDFWNSKRISTSSVFLYDGCGLSPCNAIPGGFLVDILEYMYKKSAKKEDFIASLPIAGESGTVKNLLKNSKLQGKVYAKSGSISGVQCYAGYLEWKNQTYAFSLMINHFTGSRREVVKQLESLMLNVTNF
jgi:D-alanyl-D-alanine carboxypeptidase/D-alanyl-D-alanine-endopeptidase (penicillin-binding protein 4)